MTAADTQLALGGLEVAVRWFGLEHMWLEELCAVLLVGVQAGVQVGVQVLDPEQSLVLE